VEIIVLDQKLFLDNAGIERVKKALSDRNMDLDISLISELAVKRKKLRTSADEQKTELNKGSKKIGLLMREGKKEEAAKQKSDMKVISDKIAEMDEEIRGVETKLRDIILMIPNIPDESTPVGPDESANVEIKKWGNPREFDFPVKDHVDIGEGLGILDFASAAKITGARFTLLRGMGARLERALINFFMDLHSSEHGYTEVIPPFMANKTSCTGSGNLPKFEDDLFKVTPFDYYLVPTAEIPVTNIYRDEIIQEDDLPLKFCAYTPCFRSEAGAAGKDTRGYIRQHQFQKVELYKLTTPEKSFDELDALTKDAEKVLELLELPYRTIVLCTGDMGFSAVKTFDIEVWLPGQETYREISSCSNCWDFQARRANLRYRPNARKKGTEFVHTLNGSGLAVGRTLVAVLENYQREDGRVDVPEVLKDYMKADVIG
jgi:seryl-tRNA synthetase